MSAVAPVSGRRRAFIGAAVRRQKIREIRRDRLRAAMGAAGYDALVVYGNAWQCDYLCYAADFSIQEGDGLAVITADGEVQLFVETPGEAERAAIEAPDTKTSFVPDASEAAADHLRRLGNRRIGSAPATLLPYRIAGADDAPDDFTAELDRLLMVKSAPEIAAIGEATILADEGYKVFMEAAGVGRAEYEVVADVEAFFRGRGCPENFMLIGSGQREMMGMHPAGERRFQPGDQVTTELSPGVDGYFGQICRTLVMGEPTDKQYEAFQVYLDAMEAGFAVLKPGVTAAEIAKAENDVFRERGLGRYTTSEFTRVRGHGLGLFLDTKPHILEDVDTVFEPGMTLVIHPNTYHPEVGYMVMGDSAVVTDTGYETWGTMPRELLWKPV